MQRRRAAAKTKEREEHARKFAEFSARVEAELPPLPEDFKGVSRTATLTRYLIARQYDIDKAMKMLKDSLEWRRENNVASVLDSNIAERSMAVLIKERKAFYAGYDRTGHPVYLEYTAAGNWRDVTDKCGSEDMIKAHIQAMEFCSRIVLPVASRRAKRSVFRTVNILDMRGLSMSMFTSAVLDIFSKVADIDKNNYPETLHQCYIINPPLAFRAAWALVRPMLDEKTRNKIKVLGSGVGMVNKLREFLGPDAYLPTQALVGSQSATKIEGLISAFEVVFEYIADRQRQIEQGIKMEGLATSTSYAVLNIGPGLKLSAVDFRTIPVEEDEPQLDGDSDGEEAGSMTGGTATSAGGGGAAAVPSPVSPARQGSKTPSRMGSRGADATGRRSLDAFSSPGSPTTTAAGQPSPVASTSASAQQQQPQQPPAAVSALRVGSEGGPSRRPSAAVHFDDVTDASSVNEVWFDAEEELRDGSLDSWPEGEEGARNGDGGRARGAGPSLQSQLSGAGPGGRTHRTESELTQRDFFYTDRLHEWAQKAAKEEAENLPLTPSSRGEGGPLRSFIRLINANGTNSGPVPISASFRPIHHNELDSVEQLAGMVSESQTGGGTGSQAPGATAVVANGTNGLHGVKEEPSPEKHAHGSGGREASGAKAGAPQRKGGWLCCFSGSDAQ